MPNMRQHQPQPSQGFGAVQPSYRLTNLPDALQRVAPILSRLLRLVNPLRVLRRGQVRCLAQTLERPRKVGIAGAVRPNRVAYRLSGFVFAD